MFAKKDDACYASEIATFLGAPLQGKNCIVIEPCSLDNARQGGLLFLGRPLAQKGFDLSSMQLPSDCLAIIHDEFLSQPPCSYIKSSKPRADFVKVLNHFFARRAAPGIHPTAIIEEGALIGDEVLVGPHVHIGAEVTIGNRCQIFSNVVISGRVTIGDNCVIKANATIGSEGFSFVTESSDLDHFPQLGKITIGNNVWIGANSTIELAALDETVIEDDVKIDDLVQVGHNSHIGKKTQITAGSIICGRAWIGSNVWIAPNATIDSALKVGDNAWVGMGSVVIRNVDEGDVVVGNPAKFLKKRDALRAFQ